MNVVINQFDRLTILFLGGGGNIAHYSHPYRIAPVQVVDLITGGTNTILAWDSSVM